MKRASGISTLAFLLALAACADPTGGLLDSGEPEPSAREGSGATAEADGATAPPAPMVVAAAAATPAPSAPAPAPPRPRRTQPSAAACTEVTEAGPAREIDLDVVRQALRGTDYRRGAFETNEAYRQRVISRIEAVEALVTDRLGQPELVFSVPIPEYRITYDTDSRELSVGSDLGLLRGGSAIGMGDFILVASRERKLGSYVGPISYGGRKVSGTRQEITRITGEQVGLMVTGNSSIGWPSSFSKLRLAMPPPDGARLQREMRVLFVGRLQEPFFATGEYKQEPKLDDPVEKRLSVEAIRLAIHCAALYDRGRGRVLQVLVPAGPSASETAAAAGRRP